MPNEIIKQNSKIAQDFLWKLAERYCQLKGEKIEEIKSLDDITDFSFYGDSVVFDDPTIARGVYDVAMQFAKENNMVFKAANACGDAWILKISHIDDELASKAFKENIALGGAVINKQAWNANREYYNAI